MQQLLSYASKTVLKNYKIIMVLMNSEIYKINFLVISVSIIVRLFFRSL